MVEESAPALYGRMMKAIRAGHSLGNSVRMIKLPLIFAEQELYAGAIAQFFWLTATLEEALERQSTHPMIEKVRALGLKATPGYASDLQELFGSDWRAMAERTQTRATAAYVVELENAGPVSLCAAAFILYGALVVGGGKSTQAKVRRVLPGCKHRLFDVAEDMPKARAAFKRCFTALGEEWPEHAPTLEREATRFMALNNSVVLSVRCWGTRATKWAVALAVVGAAAVFAVKARHS